jgi:hypothetical protein
MKPEERREAWLQMLKNTDDHWDSPLWMKLYNSTLSSGYAVINDLNIDKKAAYLGLTRKELIQVFIQPGAKKSYLRMSYDDAVRAHGILQGAVKAFKRRFDFGGYYRLNCCISTVSDEPSGYFDMSIVGNGATSAILRRFPDARDSGLLKFDTNRSSGNNIFRIKSFIEPDDLWVVQSERMTTAAQIALDALDALDKWLRSFKDI